MRDFFKKSTSAACLIIGITFLLLAFIGELTSLGKYKSVEPNGREKFDFTLLEKTQDLQELSRIVSEEIYKKNQIQKKANY